MKNEKDLFNEISNVLHTHEDAYVPGAWEEFVKNKKRKRGIVYIRILAAASILLFLGYAAWLFKPSAPVNTEQNQTKNTTKPPHIYPENNPGHDSLAANQAVRSQKNGNGKVITPPPLAATQQPVITKQTLNLNIIAKNPATEDKPADFKQPAAAGIVTDVVKLNADAAAAVNTTPPSKNTATPLVAANNEPPLAKPESKRYERGAQRFNYDSLANLNKPKPFIAEEKKSRNISYALMVSPSVGNQKMNFGTGVEVAYKINNNFSVSSGIAYAYVNAGSNRGPLPLDVNRNSSLQGFSAAMSAPAKDALAFASSTGSSQTVQSVKLALSGVEIPLNFQYKTKGGFFVSAGLSAMSVIGNDLSYNLINNHAVSVSSGNGLANTISVVSEEITEKSNEKLAGYVGFYTLSAGKKLTFGRGKLNIAPFIKIPFNGVSSEKIQLMHGGVQLGFGF